MTITPSLDAATETYTRGFEDGMTAAKKLPLEEQNPEARKQIDRLYAIGKTKDVVVAALRARIRELEEREADRLYDLSHQVAAAMRKGGQ